MLSPFTVQLSDFCHTFIQPSLSCEVACRAIGPTIRERLGAACCSCVAPINIDFVFDTDMLRFEELLFVDSVVANGNLMLTADQVQVDSYDWSVGPAFQFITVRPFLFTDQWIFAIPQHHFHRDIPIQRHLNTFFYREKGFDKTLKIDNIIVKRAYDVD
eukprot:1195806-Prorocentrum_minimum.AAC.7